MNTAIWIAIIGSPTLTVAATLLQYFINRSDRQKEKDESVSTEVTELRKDVHELGNALAEDRATNARIRILRFSDEVRHGVLHSKESFDQVNLDIDTYHRYCEGHPEYKNNRAVMAIANIQRVYAKCLENNGFLD